MQIMKKFKYNSQQILIPFEEAAWKIDNCKFERRNELLDKSKFFQKNKEELDFLLKITYDITDKDFEYLCKYLLKETRKYSLKVVWGEYDNGEDIQGLDINGNTISIQCKQWANIDISLKKVWEYFAQTFFLRNEKPKAKFIYITTSYFSENAKKFLEYFWVEYISNVNLLELCKEVWLYKMNNWESFIHNIQRERLNDMIEKDWYSNLERLKLQRLKELRNHLPKSMHPENIVIDWCKVENKHPFFQYWNIA